jgi:1-acyl-sn-glycerol-3-phosphate acyltransferase
MVLGCKYSLYGEKFRKSDKKILIITNHRTRLDWLVILNMFHNEGLIPGLRFSLKEKVYKITRNSTN